MTSSPLSLALSTRASRQMDGSLIQIRWVLALLAWAFCAASFGSFYPGPFVTAWLALLLVFNLCLLLLLRRHTLPRRLPSWGLVGDFIFFGTLPYLSPSDYSVLFLFGLFPAIVAALRYGPALGMLTTVALAFLYALRALLPFLPSPLNNLLPAPGSTDVNFLATGLPVIALLAIVMLVGYLGQREREATVGDTAVELEQLRRGMAAAKLFYETTDALKQTLSYSQVLDGMLEAGTAGMPAARKEDGPAVGMVLFFEANDPGKHLRVVAWRNLDRADTQTRIDGREGVVAQSLDTGERTIFTAAAHDAELRLFSSMQRCQAGVCFPLQAGLDVYGVVILATPAPRIPSEQHLHLMRAFTNQAAVAFQNARLYQNLQQERDRIIDSEANARAKLARDLHDGPTQSLASLAMRLDYVNMLLANEPEKAKQEINLARDSVVRTGKELRELLFTLRPLTLETQGLSATLQLWAQRLHDNEGCDIDLDAGEVGPEIDVKISGTVFGVIEEAVNNARKHAQGAPIHVSVCLREGNLVASVRDEGPGFDVASVERNYEQRGSLGLMNMRERARLLDAHYSLESAPGQGTRVTLVVPLGGRSA